MKDEMGSAELVAALAAENERLKLLVDAYRRELPKEVIEEIERLLRK